MNSLFSTYAVALSMACRRQAAKVRKGQNTVEYLLMLAVIVGVVLAVGVMFKPYMTELFGKLKDLITNAADQVK